MNNFSRDRRPVGDPGVLGRCSMASIQIGKAVGLLFLFAIKAGNVSYMALWFPFSCFYYQLKTLLICLFSKWPVQLLCSIAFIWGHRLSLSSQSFSDQLFFQFATSSYRVYGWWGTLGGGIWAKTWNGLRARPWDTQTCAIKQDRWFITMERKCSFIPFFNFFYFSGKFTNEEKLLVYYRFQEVSLKQGGIKKYRGGGR